MERDSHSRQAWNKGTKGVIKANKGSFKKGHVPSNKGIKGKQIPWNKGKKGAQVAWNKGLKGFLAGEENPHWKGGITDAYHKERRGLYIEEREWRGKVFQRDHFTCQECGQVGGKLTAHHIKGWSCFPGLRFNMNNGQTLCITCHKTTNNYCGRANGRTVW